MGSNVHHLVVFDMGNFYEIMGNNSTNLWEIILRIYGKFLRILVLLGTFCNKETQCLQNYIKLTPFEYYDSIESLL